MTGDPLSDFKRTTVGKKIGNAGRAKRVRGIVLRQARLAYLRPALLDLLHYKGEREMVGLQLHIDDYFPAFLVDDIDRVGSRRLRTVTLPHHRTCRFQHPAVEPSG